MTQPDQSFYMIELGSQLGVDAPVILWANGAGTFQSESFTIGNVIDAAVVNKTLHLNASTTSFSEVFLQKQNRSALFCQSPVLTSFCIDYIALTKAMTTMGETFLPDKIESSLISSFTCIKFCQSQNANVSALLFYLYIMLH